MNKESVQIHLVGSVPLTTAEDVFVATSSILGDRLSRIPDGETGQRLQWIMFQYLLLAGTDEFVAASDHMTKTQLRSDVEQFLSDPAGAKHFDFTERQLMLRSGVSPSEIRFPSLGYADAALESYGHFRRLKNEGQIPSSTRFQVSLPTPLAPISTFVVPKEPDRVWPIYEEYKSALLGELEQITSKIPVDELAVQWDVCIEVIILENRVGNPNWEAWKQHLRSELVDLGNSVEEAVHAGYHLCYGDLGGKHFIEPYDSGLMVDLTNLLAENVNRTIQWVHMPVPRDRNDKEYFEPLSKLNVSDETTIFLGLVHDTDGIDGTLDRASTASGYLSDFGISTECGFGRRPPDSIRPLIELHGNAADQIAA